MYRLKNWATSGAGSWSVVSEDPASSNTPGTQVVDPTRACHKTHHFTCFANLVPVGGARQLASNRWVHYLLPFRKGVLEDWLE